MKAQGVQTITIKDMAGIMGPTEVFDLVKAIKAEVKLPVVVHTHCTTGLGIATLMKAAEAGADVLDTAISSFSGGTSQPPTETLVYMMKSAGFEVDVDEAVLKKINDFFKPIQAEYLKSGQLNPVVMTTDSKALIYQVPGGMLSNLVAQLTAQNKLDKLPEVLAETPRVREDLGYPPLVTPMSQMVGVQATANVLAGQRYKNVSKEIKSYLRGEYGTAPGKINEEVRAQILGDEPVIQGRYADTLKPGFEAAKAELGDRARSEEDVLSYIAFPAQAEAFFEKREAREKSTFQYTIKRIDD